jgi:hypothetical protein
MAKQDRVNGVWKFDALSDINILYKTPRRHQKNNQHLTPVEKQILDIGKQVPQKLYEVESGA